MHLCICHQIKSIHMSLFRLTTFLQAKEVNKSLLYCLSIPLCSLCCPHPDPFSLSYFLFLRSTFSLFTATPLTAQLQPCPATLLSVSCPPFPPLLHHPCLSFRGEAAPVKLILLLCWGVPSTHRFGFLLTLSLWLSAFLSFSLMAASPCLCHPGVLLLPPVSHLSYTWFETLYYLLTRSFSMYILVYFFITSASWYS